MTAVSQSSSITSLDCSAAPPQPLLQHEITLNWGTLENTNSPKKTWPLNQLLIHRKWI